MWTKGSPRTGTTFPFISALHGESLEQAGRDPDRQALGPEGFRAPRKESISDSQTGCGMSLGIHKSRKDSVRWAIFNASKSPKTSSTVCPQPGMAQAG